MKMQSAAPAKELYPAGEGQTLRQTASPLRLLLQAIGGPRQWAGKLGRFVRTMLVVFNRKEIHRRLARLQSLGFMETIPTGLQLVVGGLDMVRYFIAPGAKDYYESRGIGFTFHQVLRFFDDPISLVDPVGIYSERDTIIGHVLQVVHANPAYDLQLLDMFTDGVAEIEAQTKQMIAGTHPRSVSIGAIVEDPEYHTRLLGYIQRYRANPNTPQLRRRALNARESLAFVRAEETFGTMPGAMRYFNRLPKDVGGLWKHWREDKEIPAGLCDPDVV